MKQHKGKFWNHIVMKTLVSSSAHSLGIFSTNFLRCVLGCFLNSTEWVCMHAGHLLAAGMFSVGLVVFKQMHVEHIHILCTDTLTVSPGRGLSLPSAAEALASCMSLSSPRTIVRALSISRGPHASWAWVRQRQTTVWNSLQKSYICSPGLCHVHYFVYMRISQF